jgi:predicted GNAT family acetyltransferase
MEVIHDKTNSSFVIKVDDTSSYVSYNLNKGVIEFYTTYTPPQLRGKGLAEKVVRAALDFARENNFKVIPSCSYVRVFIERNPEYKFLTER